LNYSCFSDSAFSNAEFGFKIAKRIFDFYYEKYPNGKAFPMDLWAGLEFMKNVLIGSTWSGEIDIKNKSQLDKLIKYAFS
jgi:hypothetical protein